MELTFAIILFIAVAASYTAAFVYLCYRDKHAAYDDRLGPAGCGFVALLWPVVFPLAALVSLCEKTYERIVGNS